MQRDEFDTAIEEGHRAIPVVRTLFSDAETPVGLYRRLAGGREGTFLLESASPDGVWSRWSFVGVRGFGTLVVTDGVAQWRSSGVDAARAFGGPIPEGGLAALQRLRANWATPARPGLPPLTGGLVGTIGWGAVREIEHLPTTAPREVPAADVAQVFVADLVALDHRNGTLVLIATALNDGEQSPDELWSDAQARLDRLESELAAPVAPELATVDLTIEPDPIRRTEAASFEAAVIRSQEHIRDGDAFQVVVSQRFDLPTTAAGLDVYRVLRALNPSPYLYLIQSVNSDGEPVTVVGSSPEALVRIADGTATMHPIAGSRPRGATAEQESLLADELLADPKERAEHLMLVDLARNDLLKVCEAGTVAVEEFMAIHRYSHIMHLVSTVAGQVRAGVDPIDVIRATFPAGTLSGAPKPRALEIIEALEPAQRGIYGGVAGYFDFGGNADVAIAIRTAVIVGGVAYVQAGAGVVADSDPAAEELEARNKAAAPLRAVAIANAMRPRS